MKSAFAHGGFRPPRSRLLHDPHGLRQKPGWAGRRFSEPGMEFDFRIRGLKADAPLRRQLESDLESLNGLMPVAAAQVVLEHQKETHPPFEAVLLLKVGGPDFHAAARDHTWAGAWSKVLARVRAQMGARRNPMDSSHRPAHSKARTPPPAKPKRKPQVL
jgi:hypothetical protein